MPHFAELESGSKKVLRVVNAGSKKWCKYHFGGIWIETHKYRTDKNYAGRDWIYHEETDNFYPPQPYPSWTLDTETCTWYPPIPQPDDGKFYMWSEEQQKWLNEQLPE